MKRSIFLLVLISTFLLQAGTAIYQEHMDTESATFKLYPDNSKSVGDSYFVIIPTDKFTWKVEGNGNASIDVSYGGLLRGYHTVRISIDKALKQPAEIKMKFSGKENYKRKSKTDNFLKNFVKNYKSAKRYCIEDNKRDSYNYFQFEQGRAYYKLVIKEDGIYKLDNYQLLINNIDLAGVDPRTIRIFNEGEEIPVYVYGEGDGVFDNYDYIEFYGEKNLYRKHDEYPNRYLDTETDENIYILTYGGEFGKRMVEESGAIQTSTVGEYFSPSFFKIKEHFEEDNHRNRLVYTNIFNPDVWYYLYVDGQENQEISFDLSAVRPDEATFKYSLFPALSSGTQVGGSYQMNFGVNAENFSTSWEDEIVKIDSVILDGATLKSGVNKFKLFNPNETYTRILLNFFEINYSKYFIAKNNKLRFNQGGKEVGNQFYSPRDELYDFVIENFDDNNLSIYKLGVSKIVNGVVESAGDTYTVHFQDYIVNDTDYLIISDDEKKIPVEIREVPQYDKLLSDSDNGAELLIIAHENFMENETLLNFIEHKKQKQFGDDGVQLVNIEQVLDEFSYGEYSGDALHDFLQYTVSEWNRPPTYVFLIGTSTYRSIQKPELALMPFVTFQHYNYGTAVSDYLLSMKEYNDVVPQFYIGRIPASTNEQLSAYLEKSMEYENTANEGLAYQKRLRDLYILTDEDKYPLLTDVIENKLSNTVFHDRLLVWSDEEPYQGGTISLIDKMDRGLGRLFYVGHGSGQIWANERLMLTEDVDRLAVNDYLPIIFSFSCYTGNFPEGSGSNTINDLGLGGAFIFTERKGGSALVTSVGQSHFNTNFQIFENLIDNENSDNQTLAQWFTPSVFEHYLDYIHLDPNVGKKNLLQFIILGDPSLKLTYPNNEDVLTTDKKFVTYGDVVRISGFENFTGGEGLLKLYNSGGHYVKLDNEYEMITTEEINNNLKEIVIPDQFACDTVSNPQQYLTVKFFAYGNGNNAVDFENLFLTQSNLDIIINRTSTIPEPSVIQETDSIAFEAQITSSVDIEFVKCFIDTANTGNFDTVLDSFTSFNNLYTSNDKIKPFDRMRDLEYYFEVVSTEADTVNSDTTQFTIPAADLYHNNFYPTYMDSSYNKISAQVMLKHPYPESSQMTYENVEVLFTRVDEDGTILEVVGKDSVTVALTELNVIDTKTASVNYNFPAGNNKYNFIVNSNQGHTEYLSGIPPYENNEISGYIKTTRFPVSIENGTSGVIRMDNIILNIPANAVNELSVVDMKDIEINSYSVQQDLECVSFYDDGKKKGYDLHLYYNGSKLKNGISADVVIEDVNIPNYVNGMYSVYRYIEKDRKWRRVNTTFTPKSTENRLSRKRKEKASKDDELYDVSFSTSELGIFSIFKSYDNQAPNIEVNAEGQVFTENSFVAPKTNLIVIIQDISGINTESLILKLDGATVPQSEYKITDLNDENNSIQITFTGPSQNGSHEVFISAADNTGNSGELTRHFTISEGFKIFYHGNYPNPFSKETVFCFKISQLARRVTLSIYTVSGRKIVEFDRENVINYAEIRWDGRDSHGDLVANGVYFYKLKIKSGSKEYTEHGKIAKIKK